jgi:hypothetical protein
MSKEVTLVGATTPPVDTVTRLNGMGRVTVVFPPCTTELLSLIKTTNVQDKDEVTKFFDEYFTFHGPHKVLAHTTNLDQVLDGNLQTPCPPLPGSPVIFAATSDASSMWPSECCVCSPCISLRGNRNPVSSIPTPPAIERLFIGDLVWLFYFERMGIFQILGAILDAYASNGRLPISNGSLELDAKDDVVAVVLEIMTRQMKMGLASSVRDRAGAYRTALGWTSEVGRKLDLQTEVNTGFTTQFHKFISHALAFYKDKRLAVAIQGAATGMVRTSVATLITISDTLEVLKKRFEPFAYGRSYYNTLSGIVWAIAGMSVIRELRATLGIPPAYGSPDEYIPAAYDLLVLKRPVTHGESNRYILHRECAKNARTILLDLEVVNHLAKNTPGELENWLNQIESAVEGYRTAYHTLTGTDLGMTPPMGTPTIEQQA